jgi:hypothetical protein
MKYRDELDVRWGGRDVPTVAFDVTREAIV